MSKSQLYKLKSRIKDGTEVILNFSSNVIDDSNDETYFPHKLSLIDIQVLRPLKSFANNSSANTKSSKIEIKCKNLK